FIIVSICLFICVIKNDLKRFWFLQEISSLLCKLQYTIFFNIFLKQTLQQHLADQGVPEMRFFFTTTGKYIKPLMTIHGYLWCWSSKDHIHHIFHCKPFIKGLNSFTCTHNLILCFNFFFRMKAIITIITFISFVFFSKIAQ